MTRAFLLGWCLAWIAAVAAAVAVSAWSGVGVRGSQTCTRRIVSPYPAPDEWDEIAEALRA